MNPLRIMQTWFPNPVTLSACGDDPDGQVNEGSSLSASISFGIDHALLIGWLMILTYTGRGISSFSVENNGKPSDRFTLKYPESIIFIMLWLPLPPAIPWVSPVTSMQEALLHYRGTHRRFEVKGKTYNQAVIVDDYAHHPTEIKATIKAALNYPHNRIWCIFQPHTYTRTKKLFEEFTQKPFMEWIS
jgi:UDP-N-acetylmuramate--alanine ligase